MVGWGHSHQLRDSRQPSSACAWLSECCGRDIVLADCLRHRECVRTCVQGLSLFCKVSGGRLRGEEDDRRAWRRGGHRWGWRFGMRRSGDRVRRSSRRRAAPRSEAVGFLQRVCEGRKPTGPARHGSATGVRGRRPARGGGEGGRVGGGRSDADAKVAASGHHFCARKLNPALKATRLCLPGALCSEPAHYRQRSRIPGILTCASLGLFLHSLLLTRNSKDAF